MLSIWGVAYFFAGPQFARKNEQNNNNKVETPNAEPSKTRTSHSHSLHVVVVGLLTVSRRDSTALINPSVIWYLPIRQTMVAVEASRTPEVPASRSVAPAKGGRPHTTATTGTDEPSAAANNNLVSSFHDIFNPLQGSEDQAETVRQSLTNMNKSSRPSSDTLASLVLATSYHSHAGTDETRKQLRVPEPPGSSRNIDGSLSMEDMVENAMPDEHGTVVDPMMEDSSRFLDDEESVMTPVRDNTESHSSLGGWSQSSTHSKVTTKKATPTSTTTRQTKKKQPLSDNSPKKKADIQSQRQAELNEILVMYGVNPASIKPTEIPRPLPDWSVHHENWKTGILQQQQQEEDEARRRQRARPPTKIGKASLPGNETSLLVDPMTDRAKDALVQGSKRTDPKRASKKHNQPRKNSSRPGKTNRDDESRNSSLQSSLASLSSSSSDAAVDEHELLVAAQRALSCLDRDSLSDLYARVAQNGSATTHLNDLLWASEGSSSSFLVVSSRPGLYHRLDPETLVDVVQSRLSKQTITIVKETMGGDKNETTMMDSQMATVDTQMESFVGMEKRQQQPAKKREKIIFEV